MSVGLGSGRLRTADGCVHNDADGDEEADGVDVDVGQRVDDRHAALEHRQADQQVRDHRKDEEHLRRQPRVSTGAQTFRDLQALVQTVGDHREGKAAYAFEKHHNRCIDLTQLRHACMLSITTDMPNTCGCQPAPHKAQEHRISPLHVCSLRNACGTSPSPHQVCTSFQILIKYKVGVNHLRHYPTVIFLLCSLKLLAHWAASCLLSTHAALACHNNYGGLVTSTFHDLANGSSAQARTGVDERGRTKCATVPQRISTISCAAAPCATHQLWQQDGNLIQGLSSRKLQTSHGKPAAHIKLLQFHTMTGLQYNELGAAHELAALHGRQLHTITGFDEKSKGLQAKSEGL